MLTDAQLDELCLRSSQGEGVRKILESMGFPDMLFKVDKEGRPLMAQYHNRLVAAKAEYQRKLQEGA